MIDSLWQDARHAVRSLARRPLVALVAVASLALGIGVNTAIFSLFERLLLRPLPVPSPDTIVNVTAPGPRPGWNSSSSAGGAEAIFSYPLVRDLEQFERTGLIGIAAHRDFPANLSYRRATSDGTGVLVSGGYFPLLGIAPALGRLFTPDDDRARGGHPVVVLSHRYWSAQFAERPDVVGETLVINGTPMAIVGVAPAGFTGTVARESPDVFVPLAMAEAMRPGWDRIDRRNDHWLYVFGRLQPGIDRGRAEALINGPFRAITTEVEFPAMRSGMGARAREQFLARRIVLEDGAHGRDTGRERDRIGLLLLMAATGFVLLIACANTASLLMARAVDRARETAIRLAMGATRGTLMRWMLTEACLLGLAGAAAALGVAALTIAGFQRVVPPGSWPVDVELSAPAFLYALALGLGAGALFGLFPAIHGVRVAGTALHATAGHSAAARTATRFRTLLATAQIALATALLAQAGLFLVSLANIGRIELGLDREGLIGFSVSPYLNRYTPGEALALFERLEASLAALPGVRSVTATTVPLVSGTSRFSNVTVQGFQPGPDADSNASTAAVGTAYFRTMGIPLLAGREFTPADALGAPKVAIVNEAFARKFGLFPDAVGARMALGEGDDKQLDIEIVGLVRDATYEDVKAPPPPQFLLPYRQTDVERLTFYVRAAGATAPLFGAIRTAVQRLDPNLPVMNLRTLEEQLWIHTASDRLRAVLTAAFAGLATLLAGMGLYAALAYAVARRWRELGVRVALGATSTAIARLILGYVGRIAAIGGAAGALAALALGRAGAALLFGLDGYDARVLAGAIALVAVVAAAAGVLPALRATRVNAAEALRAE